MSEPYDPIRDLCDRGRELIEAAAVWGLDLFPEYAVFLAAVDRAERWVDDPEMMEAK